MRETVEERDPLLLVPDVVAGGEAIDGQAIQLRQHVGGHPEAAGGVLDVDHHVVEAVAVDQPGDQILDGPAPRPAHDVADEEQPHRSP
jgi:hypothetical protein